MGVTALFWDFPTLSRAYIQEAESHDIMTETGKQKRVLKGGCKASHKCTATAGRLRSHGMVFVATTVITVMGFSFAILCFVVYTLI